jgi:hypothetical protein
MASTDRYTIISSDCHAGGNHAQYREYLDPAYLDDFDAWRGKYKNPFRDLQDDGRSRNWDDERRVSEQDADGVVAEVVFPNTVPPFFPTGVVIAPAPTSADYELRLAGIRAHNRWLADFVAAYPTRRCGLAQILLNDPVEAVKDVRWAKENGINGVLLPGVAPNTEVEPLYSPVYDELWATCVELGMPVTHHGGGSGMPDWGRYPASVTIMLLEVAFYANRALWHRIMSGFFERFQSMPIARSSVLWAHVLTSLVASLISVVVVVLVALLMGFRSGAGVLTWLAVAGMLILFTLALTWLAVIAGLSAKTVDGAAAFSYPIILLPFISSAFVLTATMPGPVRAFAENQPVTSIVNAIRDLFTGQPIGSDIWIGLAWCVGILLVAFMFASRAYRSTTA